jgi:endonuclease VIII
VPEGDSLHGAAERLRVLEGRIVSAEAPHPRAALLGVAERIDGKRLERVEALGKNLLLTFEGGVVVRSHLRMNGRWFVQAADTPVHGAPWLVLRAGDWQAVQRNGPVLELGTARLAHLGPDVLADPPDIDGMIERFRRTDQNRELGDALLDQALVAGIGNKWKAEALFEALLSPWKRLRAVEDDELRRLLEAASRLMRTARRRNRVYRKAGRQCPRCGKPIRSWPQGDNARMAYWCPGCQAGTEGAKA